MLFSRESSQPGIEPVSLMSPALAGGFFISSAIWEAENKAVKVKVKLLSHVRLFATPWTAAYQAPPPMGFSRQEYWSGLPLVPKWGNVG